MDLTLQIREPKDQTWKVLNRRSIKGLSNEERFIVLSELLKLRDDWESSDAFQGGAQMRIRTEGAENALA